MNFCEALFSPSYKGFQKTRNLTCIKHVDLLLASNVLNVNYEIRTIHRNICKELLDNLFYWQLANRNLMFLELFLIQCVAFVYILLILMCHFFEKKLVAVCF